MTLTTFKNLKGLIHGTDQRRIESDKEGVLRIGNTEVIITHDEPAIMPLLFHGADGDYDATFTDRLGLVYKLDRVAVRGGRVAPPSPTASEFMELRCRLDEAEEERDALREKIKELENIFDTDSLNFLIK